MCGVVGGGMVEAMLRRGDRRWARDWWYEGMRGWRGGGQESLLQCRIGRRKRSGVGQAQMCGAGSQGRDRLKVEVEGMVVSGDRGMPVRTGKLGSLVPGVRQDQCKRGRETAVWRVLTDLLRLHVWQRRTGTLSRAWRCTTAEAPAPQVRGTRCCGARWVALGGADDETACAAVKDFKTKQSVNQRVRVELQRRDSHFCCSIEIGGPLFETSSRMIPMSLQTHVTGFVHSAQ